MSYATLADLIAAFGEPELVALTDRSEPRAFAVDAAVAGDALDAAAAEIDGYVGARYSLPIAPVPALLRTLCCDLARERLHHTSQPEVVAERAASARARLRDIAAGRLVLQVAGAAPARVETLAEISSAGRVFGRGGPW